MYTDNAKIIQSGIKKALTGLNLLNIPAPDILDRAHRLPDDITDGVRTMIDNSPDLKTVVYTDLRDGKDPNKSRQVTAALIGHALRGIGTFDTLLTQDLSGAAQDCTPALYPLLDEKVKTAGDTLRAAHSALHGANPEDPIAVLDAGADAVRAWEDAKEAIKTLDRVHTTYQALLNAHNIRYNALPLSKRHTLTIANLDHVHGQDDKAWNYWIAAANDDEFTLAVDRKDVIARNNRVLEERNRAQDAIRAARKPDGFGARGFIPDYVEYDGIDDVLRRVSIH